MDEWIKRNITRDHRVASIKGISESLGQSGPRDIVRVEADFKRDPQDTESQREVNYYFTLRGAALRLRLLYWRDDPRSSSYRMALRSVLRRIETMADHLVYDTTNQIVGSGIDANGNYGGPGGYDIENRFINGYTYAYDPWNKLVWRTGTYDSYGNATNYLIYFYGVDGKRLGVYQMTAYALWGGNDISKYVLLGGPVSTDTYLGGGGWTWRTGQGRWEHIIRMERRRGQGIRRMITGSLRRTGGIR